MKVRMFPLVSAATQKVVLRQETESSQLTVSRGFVQVVRVVQLDPL